MVNRLAASTSPYLLQHAHNPVDWWEWGPAAFAEAERLDRPLLLSVGYAACHWCHVMAHESFENDATAAYLNTHFVSIKVDREERPDVDAVYLAATQAMTGSGGWPMTVFALPSGEPFFCGTYFPPQPMSGLPSFGQVLEAIADAWHGRRGELVAGAAELRVALTEAPAAVAGSFPGSTTLAARLADSVAVIGNQFDPVHGGFGRAPKFPPSMVLEWLLRHHARTGDPDPLEMADRTLEAMARGGLFDQLGGGFARYAVDHRWTVPHFEKMLYDNALLLRVYAHWFRATGSPLARRVVEETATWLLTDLRTPEGGFASSLDADSEGHEGSYYVWTPEQLREVLGPDDATWAADLWSVTGAGTFERGTSVLQLPVDPPDPARYAAVRDRLRAARDVRERPARDDKVVAAWNGLAIAALAEAGALLDRPEWIAAATEAAELIVRLHLRPAATPGAASASTPARLVRTSRAGHAGTSPAVLEDYANVAEGLLALTAVTSDDRWRSVAGTLLDTVLASFADHDGGFFDTSADETDPVLALIRRPRDPADGPTPSGAAAAAGALVTYAALTGSTGHRLAAERALTGLLDLAAQYPRAAGWALAVAEAVADGPRTVAVVGGPSDPATRALHRAALRGTAPGAVIAVGVPAALFVDRPLVDGRPAAYVCRGSVCDLPIVDAGSLARTLGARADATTAPSEPS
ncbi:thioredoxin domain-containing protein [Pengzhenrongella phosphoraccumulans]|uniref:thioredoxin domain-containing protein n=1 Tax=Pengzhenrongella phosphoraccumulans TaxID=3114394 RepID=UPI00388E38BE